MSRKMILGVVATLLMLPSRVMAAASIEELEAKLEAQQQQIQALRQELSELRHVQPASSNFNRPYSDLTAQTPSAVGRYFQKLTGATVGGYATEELENFAGSTRTFDNQRVILFVGRELTDRIRFYSELELEQLASVEADPADSRGGAVEMEQAWFDYGINDAVNLRFGDVLVPFGQFNLHHDDPLQELVDRPLVDRRVIPSTWTETGVGAYGEWDLTDTARLRYEAYVVNGLNAKISATTGGLRDARGSFGQDNNHDKALVGRISVSLGPWLDVGLAGYTGDYDDQNHRANGAALDWIAKHGPFEVLGEAAVMDLQRGFNNSRAVVPNSLWGAYVEGRYHFWPSWLSNTFLGRGFDHPRLTSTIRYDHAAIDQFNDVANAGTFTEDRLTFGLNYRPIDDFVMKFDYEINNGNMERGGSNGFIAAAALSF